MPQQQSNNTQYRPRINYQIRANQVRLIDSNGDNLGIVSIQEALQKAKDQSLDLIEINAKSSPIIAKIGDIGKMLYDEKKKLQASKKKQQSSNEMKEIVLHPNTDVADLQRMTDRAREFLSEKMKCKIIVKFRGREFAHTEIGKAKLEKIIADLNDVVSNFTPISLESKAMSSVLNPK